VKYRSGPLDKFSKEGVFMARIPESEIERLKQEIPLERLVTTAGIELQRHGADLLGLSVSRRPGTKPRYQSR
jgi:hypothetical protein